VTLAGNLTKPEIRQAVGFTKLQPENAAGEAERDPLAVIYGDAVARTMRELNPY
jgi:hypothetical protein